LPAIAKPLQNQVMPASVATNFEKVSVHGVNLEVLRIPATGDSQAAPIVFLHEGLGSVATWRDFPQALCKAVGRAGIVYSRRGYGKSDPVPDVRGTGRLKPYYMHDEAWEVLPELLRLEAVDQPILLGHSDGGTIALLHASRFPVEACIVMAPHLFVEDISLSSIQAAREAYERGDLRQRLSRHHADVDCAFWQWNDIWLSPDFRGFDISQECQHVASPVLAIQGYQDPYGTMAQIDALGYANTDFLSQIDHSPAKYLRRVLLKLEQCGHSPHKDQTEHTIRSVQDFLLQAAYHL
jgi:pimeloyl-ACP methyl ester carboxylesterase